MKNRMIALTAAAVLAVSLTACGSKAEEPAAADTKTEAAEDTASADTTGDKKVLKVAMECGYAPYNWTQPDDSNGAVPINDSSDYAYGYDVMMAKKIADEVYRKVKEINDVKNADAACCIHKDGQESHIEEKSEADGADAAESATVQRGENAADTEANDRNAALQKQLLYLFRKCQDYFVRLNWHDEVLFPHEAAQSNLRHICDAVRSLEKRDVQGALDALYLVDNNQYAFQFDDEVYHYFTEYVLNQDCDRLQWGAGRIVHHVDLSKEVKSLQKKIAEGRNDVSEELAALRKMEEEQLVCFDDDIRYMTQAVDTLTAGLKKVKEVLDF